MISLAGLNPEQRHAAETIEGPVLILAGAGSGKTRTITYRIAHMVDNLNIDPKSILGVSFTNKAAREMKERVSNLLGNRKSRKLTLSTFHSLGVKILKKEITKLGYYKNFTIFDSSDQLSIIREALKMYRADKSFDRKVVLSKIGYLKNNGISHTDYEHSSFFDPEDPYDVAIEYVYHFYQEKLAFYNAIDFDDILFLTVRLFNDFPDVAKKYSELFQFIMIDEYQDTNNLQFQLILGLTSSHNNLCVVGDDDQSIYSFRGADLSNILDFESKFPGAKVIKLEENYRSTSSILGLANKVIEINKERRDKTLWTKKKSDALPKIWLTANTDHEAEITIEQIVQYQGDGMHLADIAILYRSNTQAQPLEEHLRLSNVPYRILGGQKFYDKKEVKDIMAYLFVILNPRDQLSLRRVLNVPNRGIGKATLDTFLKKSLEENITLYDAFLKYPDLIPNKTEVINKFTKIITDFQEKFKKHSLPESISCLVEDIKFNQYIEKSHDNAKQVERRKNDINIFIESAARYESYNKSHATLENFAQKLLLQDSQDLEELNEEEDDDVRVNEVTLMTLHSSKGLEFDTIFLIGVEEETLPHKRSVQEGGVDEERRLCYVGITRARETLFMTYCKERKLFGKDVPRHLSRFLNDLKDDKLFTLQDRTTFGHMTEEDANQYKKSFFKNLMDDLEQK
ncbi:MAG: UvrD-helicase domain-containing protein [Bacteriovoracaceae bacterium]|jgi:DNA helicase II / ATP-dependent DNA helicase PcrA|nr:UvrD-helicase domain-containing protein [Bacteriovoracaceae bacterium]